MSRHLQALLTILVAACGLAGCASTPEASAARDAEAKLFVSQPADATVYIYRPEASPDIETEDNTALWMDGRLIGATVPQTYFRIHAAPGLHLFNGIGLDNGRLRLEVRPGEIYFVRLQVTAGQSRMEPVDPVQGRQELSACCVLLETWRPGQRPLLR
ncbi:MAG: DUF2846 domain-containing protein [Betaproteobacteria bacterium]|nr:MAG: DUF2846 domain-containing protein [Betaproteobacteria bacterium]